MQQNGAILMTCVLVCCSLRMLAVSVALVVGSDTVAQPFFHRNTEIGAAAQTRDLDGAQQPWLEYSFWQGQEWVKVYIPGELQLWHHDDAPALPDNTFQVWKPVVPPQDEAQGDDGWPSEQGHQSHLHHEAWTIQDWQHQGYQRTLTRHESFPSTMPRLNRVMSCRTRMSPFRWNNLAHLSAVPFTMFLPPVLPSTTAQRGVLFPVQLGDPVSPSSERHRTERANSRSPRRCGFFS